MSWTIILDHLFMVLAASTLAIIIGIPLGILAYMYPKTKAIILNLVDILQTIPALALLGLIMIVAGAGKTTVILGIMLYSLLPIARNTYLGLSEIDPGIKEAAKGVGMTGFERLTRVEFPKSSGYRRYTPLNSSSDGDRCHTRSFDELVGTQYKKIAQQYQEGARLCADNIHCIRTDCSF